MKFELFMKSKEMVDIEQIDMLNRIRDEKKFIISVEELEKYYFNVGNFEVKELNLTNFIEVFEKNIANLDHWKETLDYVSIGDIIKNENDEYFYYTLFMTSLVPMEVLEELDKA